MLQAGHRALQGERRDQRCGAGDGQDRHPRRRISRLLVSHSGNWRGSPCYFWLRFTCKLEPGSYRVVVRAPDRADNSQVVVGHSWLRVKTSAPKAKSPDRPAGLPDTSQGGFAPALAGPRLARSALEHPNHGAWEGRLEMAAKR